MQRDIILCNEVWRLVVGIGIHLRLGRLVGLKRKEVDIVLVCKKFEREVDEWLRLRIR